MGCKSRQAAAGGIIAAKNAAMQYQRIAGAKQGAGRSGGKKQARRGSLCHNQRRMNLVQGRQRWIGKGCRNVMIRLHAMQVAGWRKCP